MTKFQDSMTATQRTGSERLAIPATEVAKKIGISLRHLHKLNTTGRLPRPIRLGRSTRWPVDELRAWIAAGAPPRDEWETAARKAYEKHCKRMMLTEPT